MAAYVPDVTYSTLGNIQKKVRRLTRSLSTNQLSDADLNNYINTSILYDFPEHLRLFNLRQTFTFYTQPYVDVYSTTDVTNSVLYNFTNKYLTIHPPVYIAGFQALYSESRTQFFGIYPFLNSIASIGVTGDALTTQFTGVINTQQSNTNGIDGQTICLLKNNVLFSSIDANNNGLAMIDQPLTNNNVVGNLYAPGSTLPSTTVQDPNNYINYLTGQFVVTFGAAPGAGQPINSQTVPQQPTLPQSVLFFDGQFTVRPVPDQSYAVQMEVYARPSELLQNTDIPLLAEWWQYISYLASKKIFEDRMDLESVQQIMPELKKQELLCLRRTIVEQTSQRASTIYTEQTGLSAGAYGPGFFSGGGSF